MGQLHVYSTGTWYHTLLPAEVVYLVLVQVPVDAFIFSFSGPFFRFKPVCGTVLLTYSTRYCTLSYASQRRNSQPAPHFAKSHQIADIVQPCKISGLNLIICTISDRLSLILDCTAGDACWRSDKIRSVP